MLREPIEPNRRKLVLAEEAVAADVPPPAGACDPEDPNIAGRSFYYLPDYQSPNAKDRIEVSFKGSGIAAERLVICAGNDNGASQFVTALASLPTDASRADASKAQVSSWESDWPGGILYFSFQYCLSGVWVDLKGATVSGGVHYEAPGEGPGHKDHRFPSYDFGLEMPYLQTGRTSGANASWPRGQPQPDAPHHVILTPHFPDATYSVLWEQMTVFATMSAGAIGTTEADSTIATLAVPGHAPVSWDAEKDWGKALEKNDQPTPIARVDGITVPRSPIARFSFAWSAFNLGHPIISRIEAVRNLQSASQKGGQEICGVIWKYR